MPAPEPVPAPDLAPAPRIAAISPPALVPRALDPFPVVRIKGSLTATGARVKLLSVRASRRVRIEVDCTGRDCPTRHYQAPAGLHRLKRFERELRAGTRLEIRVTEPGYVGKVTTILIRRRVAPRRSDLCLNPGVTRPMKCAT